MTQKVIEHAESQGKGDFRPEPLVLRALRQTFRYLDRHSALRLEIVSREWNSTVCSADWWWRQLCILELSREILTTASNSIVSWRRHFKSWQPLLLLTDSHPYYQTLEISSDMKFLRAFRRELLHSREIHRFSEQVAVLEGRKNAVSSLSHWVQKILDNRMEMRKLNNSAKQDTQKTRALQQKAQQLVVCPGCKREFSSQALPRFLDACRHCVCTDCAQRPQCPRCQGFAGCSTKGDIEVLRHTAAFFEAVGPSQDTATCTDVAVPEPQDYLDVCSRIKTYLVALESEGLKNLECQLAYADKMQKSHHDSLFNEDIVSKIVVKAYRKLSLRAHPDHGGTSLGFQELNNAYETLRVLKRRLIYNRTSHHAYVIRMQKERAEGMGKEYNSLYQEWRHRKKGPLEAITDPRPPMPSMPSLELTPTQQRPLHGWRIKCSWRPTRGAESYSIRMQGPDTDGWITMANVALINQLEYSSTMIMAAGHYEVVCIAHNSYGDGPPSASASIFVPGAATLDEIRTQRRAEREAEAAEKCAAIERNARTKHRAARRHVQNNSAKLRVALQNVAECEDEHKDTLIAALWELRSSLEKMKMQLVQTSGQDQKDLMEEAQDILNSRQHDLCLFDALPRQLRSELLATVKHHRRIVATRCIAKSWWQGSKLGSDGRKRLATVSEHDLTASIADILHKGEFKSAQKAYAVWRECATFGPDELGLMFLPGNDKLNGCVTVVASKLQDNGADLWQFLEDSGMLNWSTPPTNDNDSDSESSDASSSNSDSDVEEDTLDVGGGEEVCKRERIQLLIFEVIAKRIKDAAELACPDILRLIARIVDEPASMSTSQAMDLPIADEVPYASDFEQTDAIVVKAGKKKQGKQKQANANSSNHVQAQKADAKRSKPQPARSAYQIFLTDSAECDKAKAKDLWRNLAAEERMRFEHIAAEEKRLHGGLMVEWQKKREEIAKEPPKERRRLR